MIEMVKNVYQETQQNYQKVCMSVQARFESVRACVDQERKRDLPCHTCNKNSCLSGECVYKLWMCVCVCFVTDKM